jgi:hypothetical protein
MGDRNFMLTRWLACAAVMVGGAFGVLACANEARTRPDFQTGEGFDAGNGLPFGTDGSAFGGDSGNFGNIAGGQMSCTTLMRTCTSCTDFPAAAIVDAKPDDGSPPPPANAASFFTAQASNSGGPCLLEPSAGTLIPQNWLRPRFRYVPASASQNLFEIRLHTARQKNDLVVYTTSKTWRMPKTIWDALRASTYDEDITVTVSAVNGSSSGAQPSSTQSTFRVAPAGAGGAMIYWAAVGEQNGQSWLEGFNVGDEGVADVLEVSQIQLKVSRDQGGQLQNGTGAAQCIGCHTAVPDGKSVAFLDFWPWSGVTASVAPKQTGQVPSWLTPGGAEAFSQPWLGIMSFSTKGWAGGDHSVVTAYQDSSKAWDGQTWSMSPNSRLAWINLSTSVPTAAQAGMGTNGNALMNYMQGNIGKSFGFIARTGDSRGAAAPTWSHDASTIVYVSTNAAQDGRLATGPADLYSVPYNNRAGGNANPVMGASDPNFSEYYPAFSPNDHFVAFNRAPGSEDMYYNAHSEVFVVPASGGTATRLAANDPPSCMGVTSPGVTNSWAKWSPEVELCLGKTYYWLIFSSSRENRPFVSANLKMGGMVQTSQLYITGIVVDGSGTITTYPALYIWNQPATSPLFNNQNQSNHTPTWEVVDIPPPPPIQ